MDWWEQGYPGGRMVAVNGFPRPLYPPDAAPNKKPSVDGSDIEAYKRTISRAGRWPWQTFDQTFSNGFSHGKSGDVGETGVAGVQRQQGIDDSGYIGEATFNTLRSIVIPEPLPHAGEKAMDAASVEMINAAWNRFRGDEQPEPPKVSSSTARLIKAKSYLGVTESPRGTNRTLFGVWYGMNGVPWCAIFATYCDQTGGRPSKSFVRGSKYAYVPFMVNHARLGLNGLSFTSRPRAGDLVAYDWYWDGTFDHVGIVEIPPDANGSFTIIEGNTSLSNNSNGGEVMRRIRKRNSQHTVFIRVEEP